VFETTVNSSLFV